MSSVAAISPKVSSDDVTIQVFLERVMDERDRLYDMRFKAAETAVNTALAAQEKAVNAALAAQEKQTASSFMASEKAIVKAEDAQREYNIRSNEFRGQLDDQAKTLMPRPETTALLKAMEEKIYASKAELEGRLEAQSKEIVSLRESRSEGGGRRLASMDIWGYLFVAGGLLVSLLMLIVAFSKGRIL